MPIIELPNYYPDWLKAYFNAPTEELPGFYGDWWDSAIRAKETEDSITLFDMTECGEDEGGPENTKLVTFYGDRFKRRHEAVRYLSSVIVAHAAAEAIAGNEIGPVFRQQAELPLRLTFSDAYGRKIFGGPWE